MPQEYLAIYTKKLQTVDKARIESLCTIEPQTQCTHPYVLHQLKGAYNRSFKKRNGTVALYWFTDPDTAVYLKLNEPTPDYIGRWEINDISMFSRFDVATERRDRLFLSAERIQDEMKMHLKELSAVCGSAAPQIAAGVEDEIVQFLVKGERALNKQMKAQFTTRMI